MTLFEKSRGSRPRRHRLSDLCYHRSGWARGDQNMNRSGCKSAPLPALHADVRSHLSGSSVIQPLAASEESWYRFFLLFLFFFLLLFFFFFLFLFLFFFLFLFLFLLFLLLLLLLLLLLFFFLLLIPFFNFTKELLSFFPELFIQHDHT